MVEAQRHLIDLLGIDQLLCVAGGSMGGMQALQWVASYPERVRSAIPIATALEAFAAADRLQRGDPAVHHGRSGLAGGELLRERPAGKGLAVARMIGHITFMSDQSMEEKFSRKLKNDNYSFNFDADFEVEGYLRYRGAISSNGLTPIPTSTSPRRWIISISRAES